MWLILVGLREPGRTEGEAGRAEGRGEGLEESSEVERAGHDLESCGILALPLSRGRCPWGSLFLHL